MWEALKGSLNPRNLNARTKERLGPRYSKPEAQLSLWWQAAQRECSTLEEPQAWRLGTGGGRTLALALILLYENDEQGY